jgi:hypothetical protein
LGALHRLASSPATATKGLRGAVSFARATLARLARAPGRRMTLDLWQPVSPAAQLEAQAPRSGVAALKE